MHNTNNIVSLRVKSTISMCRYLGKVTVTLNNSVLFHVLHDDITAPQLVVGHHWRGGMYRHLKFNCPSQW